MGYRQTLGAGVFVAIALLAAPASVQADGDMFTEEQTQDFGFPLSPGVATLPFDQFDDEGGLRILSKVTLLVDGMIGADITAENDSTLPAPDFGVAIAGFMSVAFADLGTVIGFDEVFSSGGVAPSDGVTGSGPDFFDFGSVFDSGSDMDMLMGTPDELAAFIGVGTINASVFASGGFTVVGSTDSTLTIDNFEGSGTVQIIYEYKLIPAPGALALLGLGGFVGVRRRRRA
ncbi:MAG: choice-of-anchor E domain-containing protein [Phycisphaerales bacterium]|nr:choice-of-anchor E domain-containing protein [Phycisphaerales bacterium]